VVTGAAGFIGSHVVHHLEEHGFEVVQSDVVPPGPAYAEWKRADLTRFEDMLELTHGVDAVCHIGGIGDVYLAASNPQLAMAVNGGGTLNLLEATRKNGVSRFVYASTWEVYGSPRYEPIDETHPCLPRHPYSISKFAGELLVQGYGADGPLRTVALRLGTAYGPRMRTNAVIPAFILKAMRHEPIEIHGTGEQFRQFTHASDIAEAFRLALTVEEPEPVYNIVSPERTTIKSLAEMITARIPARVVHSEPRPGDVPPAFVDATLARTRLGWAPKVEFRKGLEDLIDAFLKSPAAG